MTARQFLSRTNSVLLRLQGFRKTFGGLLLLMIVAAASLQAGTISIGLLSFQSPQEGFNAFAIENLTGYPTPPGAALPPDFPVLTSLFLQGGAMTLSQDGVDTVIPLGDLGPGSANPLSLQFGSDQVFSRAVFTSLLSTTTLELDGGLTVNILGDLTGTLIPSNATHLIAGDFAIIEVTTVSGSVAPVPEP